MIARLSGTVEEKTEDTLVVDVNGVGYRVNMSLIALTRAPREGERVKLRIQTVVREDAFDLFGFLDSEEEELFKLLTSVSHVGPKTAIGVLSGIEPGDLAEAIRTANVNRLKSIHGVGKKTAERLVVELKDKVELLGVVKGSRNATPNVVRPGDTGSELLSALLNLGYKPAQAERLAQQANEKLGEGAALESLVKEALKAARA
ncbi:MAG: Holliday junction branch migration protein RuvA [Deltaproteobacteria bacterium]|nr:Holliday junction branch migration protein RuvA [Deltaproteobacteria bacterium]